MPNSGPVSQQNADVFCQFFQNQTARLDVVFREAKDKNLLMSVDKFSAQVESYHFPESTKLTCIASSIHAINSVVSLYQAHQPG